MRFFFYGTLREPLVLAAVLGRKIRHTALRQADLAGYRALRVPGRDYPGLVPQKGAWVEGVVVSGLQAKDRCRLRRFEGRAYRLRSALVTAASGRSCRALVFFPAPGLRLSRHDWRFEAWPPRARLAYAARAKRWLASLPS
jgi:gamma-glutamylcyclotransferase (GGCT)/AIG2-like uncharacterized protein YtfP